jgi:hypothetical protein
VKPEVARGGEADGEDIVVAGTPSYQDDHAIGALETPRD